MSSPLDLAGIGAGPSNLSVAALAAPIGGLRCRFFDRQPELRWYPGLMLPGSTLQVSHLKDLVTLVDPTSPYTFLNFLARTGRLHRFASLTAPAVSRREYESYLRWVVDQLDDVQHGCEVEAVSFDGTAFRVVTSGGSYRARHLSVAVGPSPQVPDAAAGRLGPDLFHATEFLRHRDALPGRDVVVVGGGQSGAEVVDYLLHLPAGRAVRSVSWVSRRLGFQPLDDSPFTNELFHPDYVRYFHGLSGHRRRQLLGGQQLASDGISADLLERIYRRLYQNDFVDDAPIRCELLPGRELTRLDRRAGSAGWRLGLTHRDTGQPECVDGDVVVLATGYRFELPGFLRPIADRIPRGGDGQPVLDHDYSVPWQGPAANKVFFLNAGRLSHGVADPNLSLASWRAATVLNAVTETPWYPDLRSSASQWGRTAAPPAGPQAGADVEPPLLAEGGRR